MYLDILRCADLSRLIDRALLFLVVIAASGLAAQALKHLAGRARPKVGGLSAFAFHPFSLSNAFASFPSGHATSAFAAATALGLMTPRRRWLLLTMAAAVGASRIILQEHYPSDVLSGAALGTTVALGLNGATLPSTWIQGLRAWLVQPIGPAWPKTSPGRLDQDWAGSLGHLFIRYRHWFPPALIAGLFAIAVPPADLFGSEVAEHVKDTCAILIALAGLTVRALVVGSGHAPEPNGEHPFPARRLKTAGWYSLCRQPLYAGNILFFTGIFLMHGNRWTVLFGTVTYALIHLMNARAEEADLLRAFGAAYEDYSRRLPRWWPKRTGLAQVTGGLRFDLRRMLKREYPVIGITVIALAAAEFYEEIEEPLVGAQISYLAFLGAVILGVSVAVGSVWLAGKSRLRST